MPPPLISGDSKAHALILAIGRSDVPVNVAVCRLPAKSPLETATGLGVLRKPNSSIRRAGSRGRGASRRGPPAKQSIGLATPWPAMSGAACTCTALEDRVARVRGWLRHQSRPGLPGQAQRSLSHSPKDSPHQYVETGRIESQLQHKASTCSCSNFQERIIRRDRLRRREKQCRRLKEGLGLVQNVTRRRPRWPCKLESEADDSLGRRRSRDAWRQAFDHARVLRNLQA